MTSEQILLEILEVLKSIDAKLNALPEIASFNSQKFHDVNACKHPPELWHVYADKTRCLSCGETVWQADEVSK